MRGGADGLEGVARTRDTVALAELERGWRAMHAS
jgi:hypothetical protein